jgi:hypothetical protein
VLSGICHSLDHSVLRASHSLSRVQQLGLSARTFSSARVALQAAAETPKEQSAPAAAAASSTAVAAAPQSFSDVVGRYGGWYPFLGLAGVIAVSKEVIILNEELLLVTNFAAMFATLYFALGDTITKQAEEARAEIAKKNDEVSDFKIEQITALIQVRASSRRRWSAFEWIEEFQCSLSVFCVSLVFLFVRLTS